MFAGAAREVVFSNRQVVRQIQQDFVPVALKAALVNNPPGGVEGRLYAEIGRSKPAPQGICVANSSGKVLAWALSFDDEESISKFFDYAAKRYREFPDATKPVVAERFMRYPSHKLRDVPDSGEVIAAPPRHDAADRCPALPAVERGTLVGRVVGRALDPLGRPLADTLLQEHYMEARFEIPVAVQRQFVDALRRANGEKFQLPDALVHSLVEPAFLGQLDVSPLGTVPGSQNDRRWWEFHGQRISGDDPQSVDAQSIQVRISGSSDIAGGQHKDDIRNDDRRWDHAVKLDWQGYIELNGERVTRLTLLAEGHEKLRWGTARLKLSAEVNARHLMAGHAIDFEGGVRYSLIAEPAAADEIVAAAAGPDGRLIAADVSMQTLARIRGKVQRLHAGVKRRQQAGRDVSAIARLMQQFGPLLERQSFGEVEAILDRAFQLLGDDAPRDQQPADTLPRSDR